MSGVSLVPGVAASPTASRGALPHPRFARGPSKTACTFRLLLFALLLLPIFHLQRRAPRARMAGRAAAACLALAATLGLAAAADGDDSAPSPVAFSFPVRFHANFSIVAHLVDRVRCDWRGCERAAADIRTAARVRAHTTRMHHHGGGRVARLVRAPHRLATCAPLVNLPAPVAPTPLLLVPRKQPLASPPHLALPQTQDYPPWRRRVEVWYDGPERKVRAFVHEGFEANKTFLRRYDVKQEYVVRDDAFAECRRAYLSECGGGARAAAGAARLRKGCSAPTTCCAPSGRWLSSTPSPPPLRNRVPPTPSQPSRWRGRSSRATFRPAPGCTILAGGRRCSTCARTPTPACDCLWTRSTDVSGCCREG